MDRELLGMVIMGASKLASEYIKYRPLRSATLEPESSVRIVAEAPSGRVLTSEIVNRGVSTADTINYQKEQLVKQITLMEMHLAQGCKIGGKACDCCEKHPTVIEALAEETLGISGEPIYQDIIAWCEMLKPRTTAEASASGKFDGEYAQYAMEGRRLRKMLMGSAVIPPSQAVATEVVKVSPEKVQTITELAKKVSAGEITREEAVAKIKEMAGTSGTT